MKKKYKVGPGINCTIAGTRCVTGTVVELESDNHVVGTHISQGDLVLVTESLSKTKKGE